MKSRLFSRGYDLGTFSRKLYERYLQSELKDEVLSPAADYYDSEIMNLIVEDQNKKTEQKTAAPLVKYTVAPQKEQFVLPSGKFQEAWKSFHPRVIKRITNFLPLGSIVALMETCKEFYAEFGDSIWEERLEKRLNIAIKQRPALPNLEFIKNLHKTQQFALHHQFMSSHLLAKTGKVGTMTLTRDIVDFQPIKSLGLLEKLRIFAPANITISLFLSHDVEKNEITLWTIPERNHEISTLRIRRFQFAQEKQIVSCKFINEECFIVQLKEVQTTSEEISCSYEILIFDIYAELVRIENLASDQTTLSNHTISLNFKSAPETPITPIQNQGDLTPSDLEINGKAPSEFSFTLDPQGRIIFYGQGDENLMILIYNTKAGKLEKIHTLISKIPLLAIQIPHQKAQDSMEMFLIYNDVKIEILKYSMVEKTFSSQELKYLEKEQESPPSEHIIGEEQEEITNFHKCRYGSFKDRDGKTIEYLITLHNKKFYYIDLESKSAQRLLTIAQRIPEATADKTILEGVNLMNWNIHENILVMTVDYLTLVTVILGSNSQILELVKDSNLLVPYARMPKAQRSEWPSFGNILQTRMPPIIVFNNSYLIIINFPYVEQSFQVYVILFQSYLMSKGLVNFEYKNSREKLEKMIWEVRSNDIFEKESFTFFKKINNSFNLPELVKFEDNKLLIKLNLNLFFDLQSRTNLQILSTNQSKTNEAKWEISISEQLHLLTSAIIEGKETKKKKKQEKSKNHLVFFKSNPNHEPKNQLGTQEYSADGYYRVDEVQQRVLNKYRRKKSFEETKRDSEFSEEEEIHKSSSKKDEHKKTMKYLFSREGRHNRYEYVSAQGVSYYTDHKEYFLKKVNKKKDEKKKLRRREDSV